MTSPFSKVTDTRATSMPPLKTGTYHYNADGKLVYWKSLPVYWVHEQLTQPADNESGK